MFRSRRGRAVQKLCSRRACGAAVGMAALRRGWGRCCQGAAGRSRRRGVAAAPALGRTLSSSAEQCDAAALLKSV